MAKQMTCPKCKGPVFCPSCAKADLAERSAELRKARKAAGVTLKQLAEAAGVTVPYMHDIENGKRIAVEARQRAETKLAELAMAKKVKGER